MNRRLHLTLCFLLFLTLVAGSALGQGFQGTIRGHVEDQQQGMIPGATVTITNDETGETRSQETTAVGSFEFPNLLVSTYTLTVEVGAGFKRYVRKGIQVKSNQVVEVVARLELGEIGETVSVVGGAELVTTTSSQLEGVSFRDIDLPNTSLTGNPINLAVLAPGTTTQGGGIVGEGGSIGGNRPRMNNFVVDGVDNNDPSVTGSMTPVISEAVEEFTLLTNQFTAEYGHSAAGQFITTTKSGTNSIKGRAWWHSQNRNLNSLDNTTRSVTPPGDPKPRFDWNRFGGQLGGPVMKDKWFYFGSYEYQNLTLAGTPSGQILVPTSAGLSSLESLAGNAASGVSPVNVGIIRDLVPVAPAPVTSTTVLNEATGELVPIELGQFSATTPNFDRTHVFLVSSDYQTERHRISGRYNYSRNRLIQAGELPVAQFNSNVSWDTRRVVLSDVFTIRPTVVNELRAGFNRGRSDYPLDLPPGPGATDVFGNYSINDINLFIGPNSNLPQSGSDNVYQITDNMTWLKGAHTLKFGVEARDYISGSFFLPRDRGDYQYTDLDEFVRDRFPAQVSIRGAGNGYFAANRAAFYTFFQDSWKISPRMTLELGLRYEYTQVARDSELQDMNGIASAISLKDEVHTEETLWYMGLPDEMLGQNIFNSLPKRHQDALMTHVGNQIIFRKPNADRNNFAPRVGLAWDLFGNGKTSLRLGAGVAQDVIFGNLALLQLPPQLQGENRETNACALSPSPAWCSLLGPGQRPGDADIRHSTVGFLAGGGLLQVLPTEALTDRYTARLSTGAYVPDEIVPETYTWSASLQREMAKDFLVELRYVGNHVVHLPVQNWLSAGVPNPHRLPVFFSESDALNTNFAGKSTLADFRSDRWLLLEPFGFGGVLTQFTPEGQSWYHGGSLSVQKRLSRGLAFNSSYTWSKTLDLIENELYTSLMNPRRPFNMIDLSGEKGLSGLHHEHKFVVSWMYDLPGISNQAPLAKIINGWRFNGTYMAETGQALTVISRKDMNGDWDSAGDRAIENPNASGNAGTDVNFVLWDGTQATISPSMTSSSQVVGYVPKDPNARFIRGGEGAVHNTSRGNWTSPGINTWNLGLAKSVPLWGEEKRIEFRMQMWNAFNHPSFGIGSGSVFGTTGAATGFPGYVTPGTSQFLDETIFSGSLGQAPFQRVIQLGARLVF